MAIKLFSDSSPTTGSNLTKTQAFADWINANKEDTCLSSFTASVVNSQVDGKRVDISDGHTSFQFEFLYNYSSTSGVQIFAFTSSGGQTSTYSGTINNNTTAEKIYMPVNILLSSTGFIVRHIIFAKNGYGSGTYPTAYPSLINGVMVDAANKKFCAIISSHRNFESPFGGSSFNDVSYTGCVVNQDGLTHPTYNIRASSFATCTELAEIGLITGSGIEHSDVLYHAFYSQDLPYTGLPRYVKLGGDHYITNGEIYIKGD